MLFKPVNEKHLEHLISSELFISKCKLEYLGPVLNPDGSVTESPDMLLLDKRKEGQTSIITCECKFTPTSYRDFAHNGKFDIAIIWKYNGDINQLKDDLYKYNDCNTIIQLSKVMNFSKLPEYPNFLHDYKSDTNNINTKILINKLKLGKEYTSFVAYIAAKIYPNRMNIAELTKILSNRFEVVRNMGLKGKGNAYSALNQPIHRGDSTKILLRKGDRTYEWNNDFINSKLAQSIISKIISDYFNDKFPTDEEINKVKI